MWRQLLNYTSIQKNTGNQITDIKYEFDFVPLSSSKRDGEDSSSELDKFEASKIKQNQAIYIQSHVNCKWVINNIEKLYGPFSQEELDFYYDRLNSNSSGIMNDFQKQLINNLFYKKFRDTESIAGIDSGYDYIKMMLAAKKILSQNAMIILPYVISGKVEKIVTRKTVNKKEELMIKSSPYYPKLIDKYQNDKITKHILSMVATIISSTIRIIDFENPEIDGRIIDPIPKVIMEEMQSFALMI